MYCESLSVAGFHLCHSHAIGSQGIIFIIVSVCMRVCACGYVLACEIYNVGPCCVDHIAGNI